jgi:hypothetical protein
VLQQHAGVQLKEPFVKRLSTSRFFFSLAALGLGVFGLASGAQARSDVYFSIGVAGAPIGYASPSPVYVEPAPVYVQPAPVYGYPQPVYTQPPVYARSAPVYVQPGYSVDEEREWRREEWRRRQWRHHYWRHHHDRDD